MQTQQEKPTKAQESSRVSLWGPCAYVFDAANTGSWRIERPKFDKDKCIACGICERCCPTAVIAIDKEAHTGSVLWDHCKGCGICANECPKDAITMISEKEAAGGDA